MKKIKKIIIIISLFCIDQIIKFYIYFKLMNKKIIFNEKIGFLPRINKEQMSVFNKEFGLGLSFKVLISLNILAVIFMPIFYYYYRKKEHINVYSDYAILFIWVGSICSFFDKLIFQGSLDYILISNTILDLKDLYLFMGCVLIVFYMISTFKITFWKGKI